MTPQHMNATQLGTMLAQHPNQQIHYYARASAAQPWALMTSKPRNGAHHTDTLSVSGWQFYGPMLPPDHIADATEMVQAEPTCACGDSFTSDAMCANCLAAQQQAEPVNQQMLAALQRIGGMTMSMYVSAGEAMSDAKRLANEAIAAAEQAQQAVPVAQCPNCLGTKRQHALDPEWKGRCECAAQPPAVAVPDVVLSTMRRASQALDASSCHEMAAQLREARHLLDTLAAAPHGAVAVPDDWRGKLLHMAVWLETLGHLQPANDLRNLLAVADKADSTKIPHGYELRLIPKENTEAFNNACSAAFEESKAGTGPCGIFIAGHRAMLAAAQKGGA